MPVELKVPAVGESITEVQVGQWLKGEGQSAEKDENLVEIETDKATVDIVAPVSGVISKVLKRTGEAAAVGEVIGYLEPSPEGVGGAAAHDQAAAEAQAQAAQSIATATKTKPGPPPHPVDGPRPQARPTASEEASSGAATAAAPSAPPDGDAGATAAQPSARPPAEMIRREPARPAPKVRTAAPPSAAVQRGARQEEAVPMTPVRRRIAQRLLEAQQTAALLTTFNEVDMSAVIALRNEHKQTFADRYGIKLGFMSFFVKASIDALKLIPQVNAEIRGNDIVYHNYFDIGIAVGGGRGLVVPVLRDADRMSFAEIELAIADLATRARENSLQLEELQGGTFTISNGGVYGSMLSTPIVNPPQSGILGLHAIQDRPVAREGQVVIRPMMYLALTYDHRIVDGQGAVTFLKRVKDIIEEPMRMLVEI
jgi:2-oxoglutarate dehydrogenase E2 component (dihydrolipoamide succinyltransferase)